MAAFPGAIATFAGFVASHTLSVDNHAAQHNLEQAEIVATQNKVGTGSSTPTANTILRGTGTGTSAWSTVSLTTDVSGILPIANGGTGTTSTTGTGSVAFGTAPTISNPTITGGGSWAGSPTISTPTIADLTNSNHNHQNAAGGGQLNGAGALTSGSVDSTRINFGGSGAGIWWEEIGRTTLGSAGDTLSVSGFAARKYLMFFADIRISGTVTTQLRFNNDSGNNYSFRYTIDNAVGSSGTSSSNIGNFSGSGTDHHFIQGQTLNIAALPKLGHSQVTSGSSSAATAPSYVEFYHKWANTSAQITRIDIINTNTGDLDVGSELVVLGHN